MSAGSPASHPLQLSENSQKLRVRIYEYVETISSHDSCGVKEVIRRNSFLRFSGCSLARPSSWAPPSNLPLVGGCEKSRKRQLTLVACPKISAPSCRGGLAVHAGSITKWLAPLSPQSPASRATPKRPIPPLATPLDQLLPVLSSFRSQESLSPFLLST